MLAQNALLLLWAASCGLQTPDISRFLWRNDGCAASLERLCDQDEVFQPLWACIPKGRTAVTMLHGFSGWALCGSYQLQDGRC